MSIVLKHCPACENDFPFTPEFFPRSKNKKSGLFPQCKQCRSKYMKEYNSRQETKERVRVYGQSYRIQPDVKKRRHIQNRKQKYKLTHEEYLMMVEEQEGICAMCGIASQSLVIDHDHVTGRVRGLICARCNMSLGILEDGELVAKARTYLDK